jgi:hypothetical protein
MNTFLRRIPAAAAWVAALLLAPVAHAVSVVINAPANGANLPTVSSPAGVTVSATATLTGGATSIVSVDFKVNGASIGTVAGSLAPSVTWTPTAPGTYTLTATAVDNGPSATSTATSSSVIVTVGAVRVLSLTAPASGASIPQNSSFFLRSSASMSDAVVGSVEFFVNGVSAGTVTRAPYNLAHTTALPPGAYTVSARALLTDGVTTVDSVTNTLTVVTATGTAPTVSLTAPSTGSFAAVNSSVTLSAVASDADGFIPTTTPGGVIFYVDGDPVATDLVAPYSVTWSPSAAKSYSIRALAVDDKGNQTLSNAVIVTAVAAMPTVSLAAPANNATGTVGSAVTLTASAAASTGAAVAGVTFFQNGTQIGAEDTLAPYTVSFTPATAGTYALTATVRDDAGISATSSTVNYTATSAQPTIALTAPATGATITVNTAITVTAAPTAGTGATISQVQFLLGGTTIIGTVTSAPYSISWTPATTGNVSLTARVLDSSGASVTSSAVSATVVAAPTVSLTTPANGSSATVGSPVMVSASPTASPGASVSKVAFFVTPSGGAQSQIGADVVTPPYTVAWTPPSAGNFSLTAVVTDSTNQTATSTAVAVAVANSQPTVALTAPGVGSVLTVGSNVSLAATATAGSGATIAQVQFLVTPSGATAAVVGTDTSAPYALTWVPTTAGNYTITARVTDTNGNTVTSTGVSVTAVTATSVALTAPANNSAATVGTATTVTASATATAGATIQSVTFFATPSGGAAAQIGLPAAAAPYTVAWTPAVAGAYTLTAVALDSANTSVTSSVVAVTAGNSLPTATLTAPLPGALATVGLGTTLTANVAPGSGGATITQVQFLAGSTVVATLPGAVGVTSYSTTWTPTSAANAALTVKVTDSNGNTTTSSAVNVTAVTTAPVITLVTPTAGQTLGVGSTVNFSATASATAPASVTRVDFLAGGNVVATSLAPNAGAYTASWTPSTSGVTTIAARVTDSNGTVVNTPAINVNIVGPAITSPTNASVVGSGSSVSLTATATATAPATVSRVDYFAGTTFIGSSSTAPNYAVTWTASPVGAVTLTARVVDSNGLSVTSPGVSVTVSAFAPSVSLTAPVNGAAVGVGAATTLTASASAAAGLSVAKVEFLAGTVVVGTALNAPYSVAWTPSAAGIVALTARVTDSVGTVVTSGIVNVNVTAPSVAITSPASGSTAGFATPVTLTATASAVAPATVSKVDFYVGSTFIATGTAGAGGTYSAAWTPTATGTQSVTARVTDSNGAVVSSPAVSIIVSTTPPVATLTSPSTGSSFVVGTPVTLTATATAGGGATVARVDFLANSSTVLGTALVPAGGVYSITWTPTTATNVLNLSARVTDSNNAVDTSNVVTVSVTSSTTLGVGLSVTGGSATVPVGSTRFLTATVSGLAAIAQVEFFLDGVSIGVDTSAPFNLLFTAPANAGARVLTARATDGTGGVATSPNVALVIAGAVGTPPSVGVLAPVSGAFVPVNAATLVSGVVADADSTVSTVQVFANGVSVGNATVTGGAWSINWTPSTIGAAALTAVATDTTGNAIASPAVGVSVVDSQSPTVSLSLSPRTGAAAASTTLPSGAVRNFVADVTASSGRAVVRVEFFVNGTKLGEDTTAPYTFRYTAPELTAGELSRPLVVSARATDNAGAARDTQVSLLVISPVGAPPVVSLLTPARTVSTVPGTAITLAASANSLVGTISSVQFYVNGNPILVNGGNGLTAAPYVSSFTPTTPGAYVIDAIATDDRGNTAISNSATITAAYTVPSITINAPNPNATARLVPNVPVTLTSTATVQIGAGSSVLLVEFLLDGQQIAARTTPTNSALGTYSTTWIPTTALIGNHVLTARVTDTNSQSATSNPVNVVIANAVGTPPTVTIATSPIPGPGLQTLSQVNFLANAFANGLNTSISNVEFFLNDQSIGLAAREQTTNLYRLAYDFSRIDFAAAPVNPNNPSQYILPLYAIARDSNNNQTVSATSNLVINPATSAAPVISLTAITNTTVTQGSQIFFAPFFSDSDGTVTQISLFANGVAVQNLGSPISGQSVFTYNASTPGRFNVYAVATDDTGNTAVASPAILVQVNAVNAPETALAQPANNATVTTVNAPVFLEGTARATGTTLVPTLVFIATGNNGTRTQIGGVRVGTTNTYRAIWTPTTADSYTLVTQATVAGVQSTSSVSRQVVVNELVGIAPSISISVPGTVTTASAVNLTATAADSDGSVVGVEFFVNRNSAGQAVRDQAANTWRVQTSFAGINPGSVEVVARATDNSGNVVASSTSFINLTAASSIPPTITIDPSTTNAAFSRQVQLRANARDSDGTVNSVQYFANGSSLGSSSNASTSFQINWTPTTSGNFSIYGVATDNTGNVVISAPVAVVVRRNNPIQESAAFILQTYQDIANTTSINPLVFDDLDARISAGALERADLVVTLMKESGFTAPVNLLATYYVLMGQWPTAANYASYLATARGSLSGAVGSILFSNEYFAKYGVVPTTQLLDNPLSSIPAEVFLNRLYANAGLGTPSALNRVQFRSNNVLATTLGRGYINQGLNGAIAEFITNTNSANTALLRKARAAALFYQLDKPGVTLTPDEIATFVAALEALPDDKAMAAAALKDTLYSYRYVTINRQPQSLTVAPRSGAIFSVEAAGAPPLAYQWLLNGAPIPGATRSILSLTNASAANAGSYTVAITSSAATATSDAATLTLSNATTRLANISTRGVTSGGANVLIGGFVVTGTAAQTRQMLIRVVGPTLSTAPFNITTALANPGLEVYAGNNRNPVLANDDWGTQAAGAAQVNAIQQAAQRAGAFALPANSRDAVVLATLPPGPYTVQATVPAATPNANGVVLIEVYDVTQGGAAGPKAANVSTRGQVGTGADQLIAGFVVTGSVSRRMLIRGAGPTLAALGVPGVLADPQLRLVAQASGQVIRSNDNWASGEDATIISSASSAAGAFPFGGNSRDSAMIVMLPPGAYTVQLSGVNNATGVGIVEVYDVDP